MLHTCLEPDQLQKMQDYEEAKIQNFLAEILLDMGRMNQEFDKQGTLIPPGDFKKPKPDDCECTLKDFKHILKKQVKLTNKNMKVLRKVQDRRHLIFRDALAHNPEDIIKENNLMLRTYVQ